MKKFIFTLIIMQFIFNPINSFTYPKLSARQAIPVALISLWVGRLSYMYIKPVVGSERCICKKTHIGICPSKKIVYKDLRPFWKKFLSIESGVEIDQENENFITLK